ncbi:protein FAR1-RELATED SEQUENCE 5-like [Fagus crenata]
MEKRYFHLSHNFREISTLAVESEMMYEYVNICFEKLLTDLQEMIKTCYSSSIEGRIEVHGDVVPRDASQCDIGFESHEDITFPGIRGIKTKPTVGRPRNRLKNALENEKTAVADMENKPQREKGWEELGSRSKDWGVGTTTERRPRGTAELRMEGLEAA